MTTPARTWQPKHRNGAGPTSPPVVRTPRPAPAQAAPDRDPLVLATIAKLPPSLSDFRTAWCSEVGTIRKVLDDFEKPENDGLVFNIGTREEPLHVDAPLLLALRDAGCFSQNPATSAGPSGGRPDGVKSREQLLELAAARTFDFAAEVPPPHPVFAIGDRILSTPGNLTALSAQAKAGKSAVIGAMMAAAFNDNRQGADTLGLTASNPDGLALVHLDTEQSRHDHDKLVRKAIRRANVDKPPAWFRSYWLTDLAVLDRRMLLKTLIEEAAEACGGVFAVILDGGADLIASVNDEESARGFVAELHTLAIRFECVVVVVVHENPGTVTGKTRGHFGSEIERKAETNIRLERDGNGTVTMWADRARHCDFPKAAGVCFAWSITDGMFVSKGTASEIKASEKRTKLIELAETAFGEETSMRRCDLIAAVMPIADVKDEAAKKRVNSFVTEGIIEKEESGTYRLSFARRGKGV